MAAKRRASTRTRCSPCRHWCVWPCGQVCLWCWYGCLSLHWSSGGQTWVVEDFFANTEGGETPTEWLHRLLQKPHKDSTESSGSGKSALESIFPSIDCKTLFLPSTSLQLLRVGACVCVRVGL